MFTAGRFQLKGKSHICFLPLFKKLEELEAAAPRFFTWQPNSWAEPWLPSLDGAGTAIAMVPPSPLLSFVMCLTSAGIGNCKV